MTTLTDRYVWAVVRSIPEQQRADIERELRASITDAVDGRIDAGAAPDRAESDTLLELGDPDRLAAGYTGRPNWLIGPAYYFTYLRLLKVLFSVVLPIIVVVIALGQVIAGHSVGSVFGTTFGAGIAVAAHLGFWPTMVFAIIERTQGSNKSVVEWTPANLPQLPPRNPFGIADLIAAVVLVLFFVATAIWVQVYPIFADAAGRTIPFLVPSLWQFWLPYFFALAAVEIAFSFVIYRVGHWTWPLVAVNVVLNALFVVPALWLLSTGSVFNQEFFDHLGWSAAVVTGAVSLAVGSIGVLFALIDIVDSAVKAHRATGGSR
ncbi:MAG: permease prefix domain 1-containing protein [Pseudolysinimonas sp.]